MKIVTAAELKTLLQRVGTSKKKAWGWMAYSPGRYLSDALTVIDTEAIDGGKKYRLASYNKPLRPDWYPFKQETLEALIRKAEGVAKFPVDGDTLLVGKDRLAFKDIEGNPYSANLFTVKLLASLLNEDVQLYLGQEGGKDLFFLYEDKGTGEMSIDAIASVKPLSPEEWEEALTQARNIDEPGAEDSDSDED